MTTVVLSLNFILISCRKENSLQIDDAIWFQTVKQNFLEIRGRKKFVGFSDK